METILIAGGTGTVGRALSAFLLKEGYNVIILSRSGSSRPGASDAIRYAQWDPARGEMDLDALAAADHIVNLAGAGIADKWWTAARKKKIAQSRIQAGRTIIDSLGRISHSVQTVVQASAIGWYGPDSPGTPMPFHEGMPHHPSFLGDTCRDWEESVQGSTNGSFRRVILRFGIVLSLSGGMLPVFLRPLRFGVATILGKGRQVISWIHVQDLCRLILFVIRDKQAQGVYNAAAPHPVRNAVFARTLASIRNGKWYIPMNVPSWALQIMMGEMSIEVLKSTTVSAEKIMKEGFVFAYPTLAAALSNLLQRPNRQAEVTNAGTSH